MHPSVRIIALLAFAILIYQLDGIVLHFSFMSVLFCLLCFDLTKPTLDLIKPNWGVHAEFEKISSKAQEPTFKVLREFLKLLRRVRYILLFLLIVYAFNTPGEYLPGWYFSMAPTYEGIAAGVEQALRISMLLAGLALLLVTTSRELMIAGLYCLAQPFRYLRLDPERFAVRLWLTLYYVERSSETRHQNSLHQLIRIEDLMEIDDSAPERIVLIKPEIKWQDTLTLAGLVLFGAYLLCV